MVRAAPVALGPFVGGLNTSVPPAAIGDNELIVCENFELNLDGSLRGRPPIGDVAGETGKVIGTFLHLGVIGYAVVSDDTGTYLIKEDGTRFGGAGYYISTVPYRQALQVNDKLYLIELNSGGSHTWVPVGSSSGTLTAWGSLGAAFPYSMAVYKGRLFVAAGGLSGGGALSKVYYSHPLTSADATPDGSFDVEPGVDNIAALRTYNDNLVIFKRSSIHIFAYSTAISDAILRKISNTAGTRDHDSIAEYNNSLYFMDDERLYEMRDFNFTHINDKVPFAASSVPALSVVGERLIAYTFSTTYVLSMLTGSWSTWENATHRIGQLHRIPELSEPWYVGSSDSSTPIFRLHDNTESTLLAEDFYCHAVTKTFDFDDPMHYKRLRWWGADCTAAVGSVEGTVIPTGDSSVTQVQTGSASLERSFVKFPKALRFKQAGFSIKIQRTTANPRCALYGLAAIVGSKQTAVKTVTR